MQHSKPDGCVPGAGCFACPFPDCVLMASYPVQKWETLAKKCGASIKVKRNEKSPGTASTEAQETDESHKASRLVNYNTTWKSMLNDNRISLLDYIYLG